MAVLTIGGHQITYGVVHREDSGVVTVRLDVGYHFFCEEDQEELEAALCDVLSDMFPGQFVDFESVSESGLELVFRLSVISKACHLLRKS